MSKEASEHGTSGLPDNLYRPEALAANRRSRAFSSPPRFMSSRGMTLLWVGSLASLSFVVALASVPVPTHVSGHAVIVPKEGGLQFVAFFPSEMRDKLAPGQRLWVDVKGHGRRMETRLTQVEPQILGPDAAATRFGWQDREVSSVRGPSAYAVAVFIPPGQGDLPTAWLGSTFRVEVEVGQHRLFSSSFQSPPSSER